MKLVILQPGYLPWLGFFDQMNWADVFVAYDDVQYTKNDWRNRNRIKGANGPQWLTVPVKHGSGDLIRDVPLPDDRRWVANHLKSFQFAYAKAPHFGEHFERIKAVIETPFQRLIELDMALVEAINAAMGIETEVFYSSQLGIAGEQSERLVNICKHFGATEYLTGDAAADYLDTAAFEAAGVQVRFHNYRHPTYPQLFGEFVPHMSAVDLLFNCGGDSRSILATSPS